MVHRGIYTLEIENKAKNKKHFRLSEWKLEEMEKWNGTRVRQWGPSSPFLIFLTGVKIGGKRQVAEEECRTPSQEKTFMKMRYHRFLSLIL